MSEQPSTMKDVLKMCMENQSTEQSVPTEMSVEVIIIKH